MSRSAVGMVICLWCSMCFSHGCISKGNTTVGEDEQENKEPRSECERYCALVDDTGCNSSSNCEANCTNNLELCPEESDELLNCILSSEEPECGAQGDLELEECEDEFLSFNECFLLGGRDRVEDIDTCANDGVQCYDCCQARFSEGAQEWDDLGDYCFDQCEADCESGTDNPACEACAEDCFSTCNVADNECGRFTYCVGYCTELPPEEPEPTPEPEVPVCEAPTEPEPEPEPVTLPPSPNLSVALRRWAQIQCATEFRCNYLLTNIVAGDESYCTEQLNAELAWAKDLPGIGFDVEAVDACAQRLSNFTCDEWHSPNAECDITGRLEDGEPCSYNSQCATGWCQAARFSCGVCAPHPQEGDPCSHWSECSGGDCRDGACVPLGFEGQACDEESPCYGSFLTCVGGVCVKSNRGLGESCGPSENQAYCDQVTANLVCNNGVCEEATISATGEDCPALGWCEGSGSCIDGVCVAGPGPGDACSDEGGPYCRWPSICQDGMCLGVPDGDECAGSEPEVGVTPDAGTP